MEHTEDTEFGEKVYSCFLHFGTVRSLEKRIEEGSLTLFEMTKRFLLCHFERSENSFPLLVILQRRA
jgi:hypothetical protein